jgi:hypothetical protein
MIKFFDELMFQLYTSTLSLMDIFVIVAITGLSNMFHWSALFLILPWIVYSTHQKAKYD